MFSPINIQEELVKSKHKHAKAQQELMRQVDAAMKKGVKVDEFLLKRLNSAPKPGKWDINSDQLDKNRIFSLDDIKSVCITYRLRFLDSKYFKQQELPYDAITATKALEKELGKEIKHFKIVANEKSFKLEDANQDPMLFAQINENNFYLIHKWGTDFKWYKKWLSFPMRSIPSLLITVICVGLILSIVLPYIFGHTEADVKYYQTMGLAFVTIYSLFTGVFGGITFYKRFSRVCWNSPYFN
ncbi:MAG TPA: hypothetical protein VK806_07260 [Bacteroidia bacterium]|nr:hypothetical protein [Bacteroidia bacterium]